MNDFDNWLKRCDQIVNGNIGMSLHDLDDWTWFDAYDCGISPNDAVDQFFDYIGLEVFK